jgi:hypothetical protein
MTSPAFDIAPQLAAAVHEYRRHDDRGRLLGCLRDVAAHASPEALIAAVEPFREIPEVAGPIYERIVAARPDDPRALVILANAYWLSGRGPDVVGELAARALAADPTNRGAWHLWALTEPDPRTRTGRWRQVVARFPEDQLAQALLADNAASLAGAEGDREALALAIATYESLLGRAEHPHQRAALETALTALRGWAR